MIVNLGLLSGWVGRDQCGAHADPRPLRRAGRRGDGRLCDGVSRRPADQRRERARARRSVRLSRCRDRPGLTATEMVEAAARGELDLLYCVGGNFLRDAARPGLRRRGAGATCRCACTRTSSSPTRCSSTRATRCSCCRPRRATSRTAAAPRRAPSGASCSAPRFRARSARRGPSGASCASSPPPSIRQRADRLGCETGAAIRARDRRSRAVLRRHPASRRRPATRSSTAARTSAPAGQFPDRRTARRISAPCRCRRAIALAGRLRRQHAARQAVQHARLRRDRPAHRRGARRGVHESRRRRRACISRTTTASRWSTSTAGSKAASSRRRSRAATCRCTGRRGTSLIPARRGRPDRRRAGLQRPGSDRGACAHDRHAARPHRCAGSGQRSRALDTDELAGEEPLEIRVGGRPVSVTMRTPGHDAELAVGFLAQRRVDPLGCRRDLGEHRSVAMRPATSSTSSSPPASASTSSSLTRHVFASSSCGLCGKATIDAVHRQFPPVARQSRLRRGARSAAPAGAVARGAADVRRAPAACTPRRLFDRSGELLAAPRGRRPAQRRRQGARLRPCTGCSRSTRHVLLVSGRASFEIMQKALAARIPIVAAVSAPSSLAVEFAEESRQTLVAFVRGGRFNVYSGTERIRFPSTRTRRRLNSQASPTRTKSSR